MKLGIVYIILENLKPCYVGQTLSSLQYRWSQHLSGKDRSPIDAAMYERPQDFTIRELQRANNRSLDLFEQAWITELDTLHPKGYNMKKGGQGQLIVPIATRYLDLIKICRQVVQDISEEKVKTIVPFRGTRSDCIRYAPSFIPNKNPEGIAYTLTSVCHHLGMHRRGHQAPHSLNAAMNALALVELGKLKESDLESISTDSVRKLWAQYRKEKRA